MIWVIFRLFFFVHELSLLGMAIKCLQKTCRMFDRIEQQGGGEVGSSVFGDVSIFDACETIHRGRMGERRLRIYLQVVPSFVDVSELVKRDHLHSAESPLDR